MPDAIVKLTPFLADQSFFGVSVPEWWVWLCGAAGLDAVLVMDDSEAVDTIRVDGRFLSLDPIDLADLDEHDGVLVTPGGEQLVIAAGRSSRARLGKRSKGRHRLVTSDEPTAVHDLASLAAAETAARWHVIDNAAGRGVRIVDPSRTFISPSVVLEPGSVIWPDVVLLGASVIGSGTVVHAGCHLTDTRVGRNAILRPYTVADGASLADRVVVGPFAHLRRGTVVHAEAHIGNFVETKAAVIGEAAKANHLTYLGDCTVGAAANIGAGTITCNYDGGRKHPTVIGPGAFIGSNTSLVAPVTVGADAVTAAGSVITKDVAAKALALGRAPQLTLPNKGGALLTRNRLLKAAEPPPPAPARPRIVMLQPLSPDVDEPLEPGSEADIPGAVDPDAVPTAFAPSMPDEQTEEEPG